MVYDIIVIIGVIMLGVLIKIGMFLKNVVIHFQKLFYESFY